jgi:nucleotide-binding universal stress UspA family protein
MNSLKTPKDNVILVPIDFSTASNNAMEHAVAIADLFDNEISLLYVVEDSFIHSLFSSSSEKNLMMDKINDQLALKATQIREKYPKITVNTIVKEGRVYKEILDTALHLPCDSIVMGYHGSSAMEQVIGSTTTRVVSSSTVPVVIIKETPSSTKYHKIVLPIDLTKESRQKVSWAIHLAKQYNSEVHVIMEIEQDEFLMNKVKADLAQVERLLAKEGVNYVSKILNDQEYPDEFGQDIIQYCEEINADLVLIMTQKEVGIKEFFLGSFARQIIMGTKSTPVMAINPKDTAVRYVAGY